MSASFRCVVDAGSLAPLLLWAKYKGGNKTDKNNFELFHEYKNLNEIELKNVRKEDSGTYICVVQNSVGRKIAEANLEVLEDYEAITDPPVNITAYPGESVTFHCR